MNGLVCRSSGTWETVIGADASVRNRSAQESNLISSL